MIDRDHDLPLSRQAKLLDISRGTVYYQPKPVSPRDQMLMNRIDRCTWNCRLPVPECCGTCCVRKATRWAVRKSVG